MSPRRQVVLLALLVATCSLARAQEHRTVATRFLGQEDARRKLLDDSLEPYFSTLQPIEIEAKTGSPLEPGELGALREECRRRYADAVREFSPEERMALVAWTGRIDLAWRDEYPLVAEQPWSFLKVAATIEGGLPHTRGDSIVLSEKFLAWLLEGSRDPGPTGNRALLVLIHEQAHVMQRLHPQIFEALYTGPWGFRHVEHVASNAWLDRQQLRNPDGPDTRFVLPLVEGEATTLVQPLVVLTEGERPRRMPRDFSQIAVTLEERNGTYVPREDADGRPLFRPLGELEAWTERFGGVGALYHPNEIFAELFSTMVLRDHFGGKALERPHGVAGKDFKKLRAWCREQLGRASATLPPAPGGRER